MTIANDFWMRGQAAQTSFMHISNYNAALMGTAALQTWHVAMTAPAVFWSAMARVGESSTVAAAEVVETATAEIVEMAAVVGGTSVAAPAAPDPEPVDAPVEAPAMATVTELKPVAEARDAAAAGATEPVLEANPVLLDAPRDGQADDLTVLTGIGPKLATALNEFGIFHFDQLAQLDASGLAWLNANQKGFAMTAERYDIIGQAKAKLEK